jgi:lysine 2,3-aminomutase
MDLVGNDTLQVLKYKFEMKQNDRWDAMLDYLRVTPQVRDVVVSGGDMANVPAKRLQEWLFKLMDIENIRDIRIATKGLMGIPPALPAGRRARRLRRDRDARARARTRTRAPHARERRAAGDAAGRHRGAQAARHGVPRRAQPRGAAARGEHHRTSCSSCASRCWITARSCPTTSTCAT